MNKTLSDLGLLIGLTLSLLLSPPVWGNTPPTQQESQSVSLEEELAPDQGIRVELTHSVTTPVLETDSPQSIAEKIQALNKKLEVETNVEHKSWLAKKIQQTVDKFNFAHRFRVGRREVNAAGEEGTLSQIPIGAVIFNGAAAIIGIHAMESLAIGPGMISIANTNALPDFLNHGLRVWGTLLINPVPTGIPLIDVATESFCWMALIVIKTDTYHRGMYWIEMSLLKIGGALAHRIGLEQVWNALMEKRSGFERFLLAYEKDKSSLDYQADDLSFFIKNKKGEELARLKVTMDRKSGDLKLEEFELFAAANAPEGRQELTKKLRVFGNDIRDAVLNPSQLVSGEHGSRIEDPTRNRYTVKGTSVLLSSRWYPKLSCQNLFTKLPHQ